MIFVFQDITSCGISNEIQSRISTDIFPKPVQFIDYYLQVVFHLSQSKS